MSQVRIIAGTHRSRRIEVQDAAGLRPTTDRVRETLFNWLGHDIKGMKVLDLYAGSGALGFEAASRGAKSILMTDFCRDVVKQLAENNEKLGFKQVTTWVQSAQSVLKNNSETYDLIFLDPPFDSDELNKISAIISDCTTPGALLYREYRKDQKNDEKQIDAMNPDFWTLKKQKTAGQVCFELWKRI